MSYRGRMDRNWGGLIASALAVPLVLVWTVIEFVGGTLACEGVDKPCGAGGEFLIGVALILAAGITLAWVINRVLSRLTGNRN
jgi:hypothetical protein